MGSTVTGNKGSAPEREPEKRKCLFIVLDINTLQANILFNRATTSKEGSRRANYPIPTRGGSDIKN